MAVLLAAALLVASIDPVPAPVEPEFIVHAEPEPEPEPVYLTPREYLYAHHPGIARRMDCVIQRESRWTPSAVNPRSGASGLAQFLRSTWATTPQARAGQSVFDPYANIDGAAWLARNVGWSQWQVVTMRLC